MRRLFMRYLQKDGRAVELQNSVASIIVGIVFFADQIMQGGLEARYPQMYNWLAFFPLWVWGTIYICAGVIHIYAVVEDRRWLRKQILLIKGTLWVFLGLVVLQGEIYATSGYCYLLFALSALFAFLSIPNNEDVPTHDNRNVMALR